MSDTITRRLRVRGRVQGVWFRGWTVDVASALNLDGWVRNRRDGSVEILARGSSGALDALAKSCRTGPPTAQVEAVAVEPADEQVGPGFSERPTL